MPVVALTAQFVKGIKPPAKGRAEYWDSLSPGLCLRVTANGSGAWSLRYRPREGGKQNERITFGSWDALTLADARDRAARVRAEVVDGGNPQLTRRQKREAAKSALTFDALADRYLVEYARPKKASWKDDEQRLVRARVALGSKDALTLTRKDFIAFLDQVKRTAPVQANRLQSLISGIYNWAIEEDLLEANPVAGMRKRAKEAASTRTLSDAEVCTLWAALDAADRNGVTSLDIAEALKLLLLVGQRPGEITGSMQRELVALDEQASARWEIPAERMKARRPHVVPLAPMAQRVFHDAVARRRQEGAKAGVFGSRYFGRETLARHSLSQALRRIIAGLPETGPNAEAVATLQADPPTPHDFRRSVATGLAVLGISREDRLAVLAHNPADIHAAHYDQYDRLKEKRAALEAWERHLAGVLDPRLSGTVLPLRRRP